MGKYACPCLAGRALPLLRSDEDVSEYRPHGRDARATGFRRPGMASGQVRLARASVLAHGTLMGESPGPYAVCSEVP